MRLALNRSVRDVHWLRLAIMIFFQVLVNVGMVMGMLPVTGIPLPFISYGGASLVSLAAGLGTLQSTNLRREKPEW